MSKLRIVYQGDTFIRSVERKKWPLWLNFGWSNESQVFKHGTEFNTESGQFSCDLSYIMLGKCLYFDYSESQKEPITPVV